MQKRIFTLPILIISITGALAGYYFGVITQRNKTIAIRLNTQTQTGKNSTKTTEIVAPKIVAQPKPAISTSTTTDQIKPIIPKYTPKKRQSNTVKKVVAPTTQPATIKPVITPTPQPVVQTPPTPTTKVS